MNIKGRGLFRYIAAAVLFALFSASSPAKADDAPFRIIKRDNADIIALDQDKKMYNSTISENWLAWERDGRIVYADRKDPNNQYEIGAYFGMHNPDIDGNDLAFDGGGSIFLFDMRLKSFRWYYRHVTDEVYSCPRISNGYVAFRVEKPSGHEISVYSKSGKTVTTITNSGRPKGKPDIDFPYVVWPELVQKPNSRPDLIGGDWDVKGHNILTGDEFVVDDDPNVSSDSCAIRGDIVAYNANTCKNGCTDLRVYYIISGRRRQNIRPPPMAAEINDLKIYGEPEPVLTWTRVYHSSHKLPTRIEAVELKDTPSHGFVVHDEWGNQHSPDVYKGPDGKFSISYIVDDSFDPYEFLSLISKNWLKRGSPGFNPVDCNKDGIINFKDYAIGLVTVSPEEKTNTLVLDSFDHYDLSNMYELMSILGENWLKRGMPYENPTDFNLDNITDFKDFAIGANKISR
jgi:hypothetical protein